MKLEEMRKLLELEYNTLVEQDLPTPASVIICRQMFPVIKAVKQLKLSLQINSSSLTEVGNMFESLSKMEAE